MIVHIVVVHIVARPGGQRIVTIIHVRRAEPKITITIQSLYAKGITPRHTVGYHFSPMLQAGFGSHTAFL